MSNQTFIFECSSTEVEAGEDNRLELKESRKIVSWKHQIVFHEMTRFPSASIRT